MKEFSRRQLIHRDYNPLEDPEGPDRADLEKRYGLGRGARICLPPALPRKEFS